MGYRKNASALATKNGFMINFHGFCFFVTKDFKYQPWKKTIESGILPPPNEYGRLRLLNLTERRLTDDEEAKAAIIAKKLEADPKYGLEKAVVFKTRSEKIGPKLGDLLKKKNLAFTG